MSMKFDGENDTGKLLLLWVIIFVILSVLFYLVVFVASSHAYTIVDTVYVPDSITVTMSWEEWERVRVLFAQDSLWKRKEIRDSILKTLGTRYLEEPSSHRQWLKERKDKIEANKNIDITNRELFVALTRPIIPVTCRVYGFLYHINGSLGTNATVRAVTRSCNNIVTCVTDKFGYYSLDLIPGSEYEITIACRDGKILRKQVIIPNSSSWQLVW